MSNLTDEFAKLTTLPLNMMQQMARTMVPGSDKNAGDASNQLFQMMRAFCPFDSLGASSWGGEQGNANNGQSNDAWWAPGPTDPPASDQGTQTPPPTTSSPSSPTVAPSQTHTASQGAPASSTQDQSTTTAPTTGWGPMPTF